MEIYSFGQNAPSGQTDILESNHLQCA